MHTELNITHTSFLIVSAITSVYEAQKKRNTTANWALMTLIHALTIHL